MKHKWLTIIMMTAAIATSCSGSLKEDSCKDTSSSPLTMTVRTGLQESRSIITGSSLGAGEEIGIFLTDEDGDRYDGIEYSNIRFSSKETSSGQSWYADSEVMLSASKAVLHAYYPYSSEIEDICRIPVTASSDEQTDYMYADPVTGLNNHNPDAMVTMKHALAAVRISLQRGTYTGQGEITGITISGENMATAGILDGKTGEFSSVTGKGESISASSRSFSIDDEENATDILAIPTGLESGIEIEIIMDGETFTATTGSAVLNPGMISIFEISINNSSATISPVKVKAWGTGQKMSSTLQKNWNITLEGDTEDITFSNSVNADGSVTIVATPVYPDGEVNPVTVNGTVSFTESIDNGVRTIVLSDISSDVSIVFDSYILWLTAVYDITDTDSATRIINSGNCTKMQIDGQEVPALYQYKFENSGEHTVRVAFSDKSSIPEHAFERIKELRKLVIPEGVRYLDTYSLSYCTGLEDITLPETLTTSGYDVMSFCRSLKKVILPDNLAMGYGMFRNCSALEEVILPKNLVHLPKSTFYNCSNLTLAQIPESVTIISDEAFRNSGITSLEIPAGVTEIPPQMCSGCYSLKSLSLPAGLKSIGDKAFTSNNSLTSIISRAPVPPKLGTTDVFRGVTQNGTLKVPEGSVEAYRSSAWMGTEAGFLGYYNWSTTPLQEGE